MNLGAVVEDEFLGNPMGVGSGQRWSAAGRPHTL